MNVLATTPQVVAPIPFLGASKPQEYVEPIDSAIIEAILDHLEGLTLRNPRHALAVGDLDMAAMFGMEAFSAPAADKSPAANNQCVLLRLVNPKGSGSAAIVNHYRAATNVSRIFRIGYDATISGTGGTLSLNTSRKGRLGGVSRVRPYLFTNIGLPLSGITPVLDIRIPANTFWEPANPAPILLPEESALDLVFYDATTATTDVEGFSVDWFEFLAPDLRKVVTP